MAKSKIEWCDRVWNPVTGCTKVSPGCLNCYAERMSKRFAGPWGLPQDNPFKVTMHQDRLNQPLHWKKSSKVFVCSMADLFHEDVPFEFIGRVFDYMRTAHWHTFLVLTKRPERMQKWCDGIQALPNVWIGVTAENQEQADKRIPLLLQIPAAKRFVSVEPMLGPVDLTDVPVPQAVDNRGFSINALTENDDEHFFNKHPKLDWVICGGESGPEARPLHPDWVRSLRDQCVSAEVPFLFKQWGEFCAPSQMSEESYRDWDVYHGTEVWDMDDSALWRIGKKAAGRLLDGELWDQYPDRR